MCEPVCRASSTSDHHDSRRSSHAPEARSRIVPKSHPLIRGNRSEGRSKRGPKPPLTCDFVVRPLGFEPRTCGLRDQAIWQSPDVSSCTTWTYPQVPFSLIRTRATGPHQFDTGISTG